MHVPARMGGQVATDLLVLVKSAPIPQQDKRAPMVSLKVLKEPEDVRASDIFLGVQGQSQGDASSAWRNDQSSDARDLLVGMFADLQERGDPT